jgi:DNA-binding CsgD family transcriptional regulator
MNPRREEAKRLRAQGMSLSQIGRVIGVSRQRVAQLLAPPPECKPRNDRRQAIVSLYEEGLTDADIARTLGVCLATVSKHRRGAGIKGRKCTPLLVPCEVDRLLEMVRAGVRYAAIGEAFGISRELVGTIARKHGVRRATARTPAPMGRTAQADITPPPAPRKPHADPHRADVLRLHSEGKAAKVIAQELEIPCAWVYRTLSKAGVKPNRTGSFLTKACLPIVVTMLRAGESRKAIAEAVGVSLYQIGIIAYRLRLGRV